MTSDRCACSDGYYDSGLECDICHVKCKKCTGRADFCIGSECSDMDTREEYPYCRCKGDLKETG